MKCQPQKTKQCSPIITSQQESRALNCKYERSVGILLINVSLSLILLISPLKVTQQLQQYELSRHKGIQTHVWFEQK
jgi:hypothetical protein